MIDQEKLALLCGLFSKPYYCAAEKETNEEYAKRIVAKAQTLENREKIYTDLFEVWLLNGAYHIVDKESKTGTLTESSERAAELILDIMHYSDVTGRLCHWNEK